VGRWSEVAGIDLDPTVVRSWSRLRAYWRHVRGPCARCGLEIDYDGPRYIRAMQHGIARRVENRWQLDIGHKMLQDLDHRRYWAPVDTQPEHVYCNRRHGAAYGNRKRGILRALVQHGSLHTSRDW
jgi:hypothetical protein